MKQIICRKCGVQLTEVSKGHRGYICRLCLNKYNRDRYTKNLEKNRKYYRDYYLKNKENYLKNSRNYRRKNCLTTNGIKLTHIQKRSYPQNQICELCGRQVKRLAYHHWDDKNLMLGIWICWRCHFLVEIFEDGLHETILKKYIELKEIIERDY